MNGKIDYDSTKKEWVWSGQWAFGNSVAKALALPVPTRGPTASKPRTQPFSYQWKATALPSEIAVPSLKFLTLAAGEEATDDDAAGESTTRDNIDDQQEPSQTSMTVTNAPTGPISITTATSTTTAAQNVEKQDQTIGDESKETTLKTDVEEVKKANPSSSDVEIKDASGDAATATTGEKKTVVDKSNANNKTNETEKEPSTDGGAQTSVVAPDDNVPLTKTVLPTHSRTNVGGNEEAATKTLAVSKQSVKTTFASVMPGFTDACTKYQDKSNNAKNCPPSGRWQGSFDNITGRSRDKKQKMIIQQVEETFHLFLNATPDKDAKFAFEDDDGNEKSHHRSAPGASPLVQIRGCGENQFGDFEIFGHLDVETMTMEIQRQYVYPPEIKSPRIRERKSGSTLPSTARPTSTRKRQPTWKRMSSTMEDDEQQRRKKAKQEQLQIQTRPTTAQSQLQASQASRLPDTQGQTQILPTPAGTSTTAQGAALAGGTTSFFSASGGSTPSGSVFVKQGSVPTNLVPASAAPQPQSTALPPPSQFSFGKGANLTPLKISLPSNLSAATRATGASGSTPKGGGTVKKAGKSSKRSSGSTSNSASRNKGGPPALVGGSASNLRLPPAGDPKKARWRAAHFLYYQRHDPTEANNSAGDSSPKAAPAPSTPKYVIYTGEMAEGKREGRGLCLYNNGTLYQGFWKGGKEHGFGTIMTADRRKVIFEGNFERGKMTGFGTYYYSSSNPSKPGARYIGEFRENQRSGVGRYIWPDGSEFNGNWNQDQMTHGDFIWPDGSSYSGGFKDSKRSGPGLLRASDGFVYDGMWDNNAMEGRGLAIYPSGQRFEGLFSKGRREGRGTIFFTNGAIYEGRFRNDAVDGQGTMKMTRSTVVPRDAPADTSVSNQSNEDNGEEEIKTKEEIILSQKEDFMIPISFASDMTHIHARAGFTAHGE